MAVSEFPNILLVGSSDIYDADNYRSKLRARIDEKPLRLRAQIGPGSHDFWITYPYPGKPGASNHAHEDMGVSPRPPRGIVQMNELPANDGEFEVKKHLRVLAQEVGHHWLVPETLEFRGIRSIIRTYSKNDLVKRINQGGPFEHLPFIARDNSHWSAYMEAQGSPLDGQTYVKQSAGRAGFQHWRAVSQLADDGLISEAGLPFTLRGLRFSELDLRLMGAIRPEVNHGSKVEWLQPSLTAELDYHAGLCLAFGKRDYVIFGFYRNHQVLGVRRTGDADPVTHDLGSRFTPMGGRNNSVKLRIVRTGDSYAFQARIESDDRMARDTVDGLFDASRAWVTVDTREITDTPRAMGCIVNKWEDSDFVDLEIVNLEWRADGVRHVRRFQSLPETIKSSGLFRDLGGTPLLHLPRRGAIARLRESHLRLIAPFATDDGEGLEAFDLSASHDAAPKVLLKPPTGDFAFGTAMHVGRSMFAPWAGGHAVDKTMSGHAHALATNRLQLPGNDAAKRERPRDGFYRFAFIVVTRGGVTVPDAILRRINTVREHWERVFSENLRAGGEPHRRGVSTLLGV